MEQNKLNESDARDLYNKVKNGEMSLEQAAKVLAEYPIIAKMLADMLKDDAKQHKEISDAEHKSIDKLTELMAAVWSDTTATPEQKQAQCDKILEQQKIILEAQKKRQKRHENRKDFACFVICGLLVVAACIALGCHSSKEKVIKDAYPLKR